MASAPRSAAETAASGRLTSSTRTVSTATVETVRAGSTDAAVEAIRATESVPEAKQIHLCRVRRVGGVRLPVLDRARDRCPFGERGEPLVQAAIAEELRCHRQAFDDRSGHTVTSELFHRHHQFGDPAPDPPCSSSMTDRRCLPRQADSAPGWPMPDHRPRRRG